MRPLHLATLLAAATALSSTAEAGNGRYELRLLADHSVEVSRDGAKRRLEPRFALIVADADPRYRFSSSLNNVSFAEGYALPMWNKPGSTEKTDVVFEAGRTASVRASAARQDGDTITWTFAPTPQGTLAATLSSPADGSEPVLRFSFTPTRAGWYSIGFTGAPAIAPEQAERIHQPLVWQEKRFPRAPLLTTESMGGLPFTFYVDRGLLFGVVADPSESPFRLPVTENARFGVMLRNREGKAQPAVFAPILGGAGSFMDPGKRFDFAARVVLSRDDWYDTYRRLATALYRFRDLRQSRIASLNETIDNMVGFAMDDAYSGWNAELKGFDYRADVPGTVKVVSALHPLAAALIRDDPEIYRRRALPLAEYMLSREKFLFSINPGETKQSPSHRMAGPTGEVSEMVALDQMFRGRSPVFAAAAREMAGKPRKLNQTLVSEGGTFAERLALYRLTGEPRFLAEARAKADAYIKSRIATLQTDFTDVRLEVSSYGASGGQFWSDYAPRWVELYELFEETGDKRYLDAAVEGARLYVTYAWAFPTVPDAAVAIDEAGAPLGQTNGFRPGKDKPLDAPRQVVPAWQLSQIGLTPEAANTHVYNPAVLLAMYAPYFLRVAEASGDAFLKAMARSAIIGRYANFPTYTYTSAFTAAFQRRDYPLRPYEEFTYSRMYYNHVWPHVAMLYDYLVSDFETKSDGAIAFPSRYAEGYAYLKAKVYGDRAGRMFGHEARLWMPAGVVRIDAPAISYLTGYGPDGFFIALTNESDRTVTANLRIDTDRVPMEAGRSYEATITDGRGVQTTSVVDGVFGAAVAPGKVTFVRIPDVRPFTRLHRRYFEATAPASGKTFERIKTPTGDLNAMLLSLAPARTNAFVWLSADASQVRRASLRMAGGEDIVDAAYPYEFSVPLADGLRSVPIEVSVELTDGSKRALPPITLQR